MNTQNLTKPKRIRLSKKQRSFLFSVLADGRTVQSAMSGLRISAHTFYKWIHKPLFLQAIQSHLSGFQIQTRVTAATQAPLSVDSFFLFSDTQDPKKARQACLDALKTYNAFYAAYKNAWEEKSIPERCTPNAVRKEIPMENQPVAPIPKYNRLTKKQSIFLNNIFEAGQVFEQALSDLSISYRMLYSWLQQPRFLHAIEVRMAQFHLQTRLQSARSACHAVQSLSDLSSRSLNHGVVRQASMDLLKIHHALDTEKYSKQVAQKCAPDSHRCAPAAQKCAPLRASGTKMRAPERPQIRKLTDLCPLNPADTPKIRLVR